jgi:hypothetical protein
MNNNVATTTPDGAIRLERAYQDAKWGTPAEHPHSVLEWIEIARNELDEARLAWMKETDERALAELVQVAAVCVACLEQHGIGVYLVEFKQRRDALRHGGECGA